MKIRFLLLAVIVLSLSAKAVPQKISVTPFGKTQAGYGLLRGYTDPNYNFFTAGNSVEESTYQIFQGVDFSVVLGAAVHRPGSDLYDDSFLDVFVVHKRLTSSSNTTSFTGAGLRVVYRFFYGGIVIGKAGNRDEIPVELDAQNDPLNFGDLHGITPLFNVGLRAPLNSVRTLFLEIPFDFVIPRNRLDDEPAGSAALYEWYSIGLGISYYLPVFDQ